MLLLTVALVMASMLASALPAFATQPTGVPGEQPDALPVEGKAPAEESGTEPAKGDANSLCGFSGINDDPNQEGDVGLVQSYGDLVAKDLEEPTRHPGDACRG